ncbi:MAG: hypothetical protein KDM91_22980, partial [Verrucomicrobiae bacterium]|nr:hypothetical protein [Verrucomicrobiae bacterium]
KSLLTGVESPRAYVEPSPTDPEPPPTTLESPRTAVEQPLTVVESPLTTLESPPTAVERPLAAVESPRTTVESPLTAMESGLTTVKSTLTDVEFPWDQSITENSQPKSPMPPRPKSKIRKRKCQNLSTNSPKGGADPKRQRLNSILSGCRNWLEKV